MRPILKKYLNQFIVLSFLILLVSCKKEKIGIDGLPPTTQTGKQTLGCLVNGALFTPKTSLFSNTPALEANYYFWDGSYNLTISANRKIKDNLLSIDINTIGILIKEGMTIPLTDGSMGGAIGSYTNYSAVNMGFKTNNQFKGELKITRFDEINHIISGTFWFDGEDSKGEKVEVREGRFDIKDIRI